MSVSVIGLMHDPWYSGFRNRKHHLMSGFAADPRVGPCLYVEPAIPGSLIERLGRVRGLPASSPLLLEWRERVDWSRCPAGFLGPVVPGRLHVLAPETGFGRGPGGLTPLLRRLAIDEYVLWVHSPLYADLALSLDPLAMVYDCTDDFTTIQPEQAGAIRDGDDRLLARADLVTTVSRTLYERKSAVRSGVHLLPNAVDPGHFDPDRHHEPPEDLRPLGDRPVVGYVGRVNERLDLALLADVAGRRPDLAFVLVGPVATRAGELQGRPNVVCLGARQYRDLPAYVARMDVCVIPHVRGDVTAPMNPIKVYEYLAMGKPVVSTPVGGLDDVIDEVAVADGPEAFTLAIDAALTRRTPADRARRRAAVLAGHTWADRVRTVWDLLGATPGGRVPSSRRHLPCRRSGSWSSLPPCDD